jgi:hypothetical protein
VFRDDPEVVDIAAFDGDGLAAPPREGAFLVLLDDSGVKN